MIEVSVEPEPEHVEPEPEAEPELVSQLPEYYRYARLIRYDHSPLTLSDNYDGEIEEQLEDLIQNDLELAFFEKHIYDTATDWKPNPEFGNPFYKYLDSIKDETIKCKTLEELKQVILSGHS